MGSKAPGRFSNSLIRTSALSASQACPPLMEVLFSLANTQFITRRLLTGRRPKCSLYARKGEHDEICRDCSDRAGANWPCMGRLQLRQPGHGLQSWTYSCHERYDPYRSYSTSCRTTSAGSWNCFAHIGAEIALAARFSAGSRIWRKIFPRAHASFRPARCTCL